MSETDQPINAMITANTPRQQISATATMWLWRQCPNMAPDDIHTAAVKIANIVLGLRALKAHGRFDQTAIQPESINPGLQQIMADAIAEVGGQTVSELNGRRVILALREKGADVIYASQDEPQETAPIAEASVSAQKVIAFCDRQLSALAALESVQSELKAMRRAAQAALAKGDEA